MNEQHAAPSGEPANRFAVDRLGASERRAAVVAIAAAFHDDPLFNFLVPDLVVQTRAMLTFVGSVFADAVPFDEVWVARPVAGAATAGVAVWLPPGGYPRGARRDAVSVLRDMRSVLRLGSRVGAGMRLNAELARAHARVREPHWYLALLGVDPGFQRRGAGSALLAPVLARADHDGLPVYLETQKADNVPWYRRHGFEALDEIRPRGCPPMWPMRRDPR